MNPTLVNAVKHGEYDTVERLTEDRPDLAGTCDENGVSLIFVALYNRQEAIAQLLARHVPGISLHEAAALGDLPRLEQRLQADLDLARTPTADGFFAQHLAAFFARVKALDLLLRSGADPNAKTPNEMALYPLHSAVAGGSLECVHLLLDAGARADAPAAAGFTSLMSAAGHGHAKIVDLLLARGAHPHRKCDKGLTAADYARSRDHFAIASRLERIHGN